MRFNAVRTLLFFIYLTTSNLCLGMHIPVALLFEQHQNNPLHGDSSPIDPMLAELAIHIDQQCTPLVVSRQLVHQLIRHQAQFKAWQKDRSTKLGTLVKYIMHYTKTHSSQPVPNFAHIYSIRNRDPEKPTVNLTPTQLKYGNKIVQFLENHPNLVSYLFVTEIPIADWKVYQIKESKKPQSNVPLYVLMPPTRTTVSTAPQNSACTLVEVGMDTVMRTALSESPDAQRADYQRLSARTISRILQVIRSSGSTATSSNKLILSLGGHGLYTRSKFGIAVDRIKPATFHEIPTPDQYALEAKDSTAAIAGLEVPAFKKLLSLLQANGSTELLYYDSCYTGNHHLVLPYQGKPGASCTLSFHAATRGIDAGLSYHDHFKMGFDPKKAALSIICPMDPKKFFERTSAWCALPQEVQKPDELKAAFLAIIGNRQRNHVMLRPAGSSEFSPLVTGKSLCITPEMLQDSKKPITLKKRGQIFLRHNKIDRPIKGQMPMIRSAIPTNSTMYIREMDCTDTKNSSMLAMLSHIFFHPYNQGAINRMIFFVKALTLHTQNTTHKLRDVLIVHNTCYQHQRDSFAIWKNPKKQLLSLPTYSLARSSPNKGLLEENVENTTSQQARNTLLFYLGLDTQEQSYIEAPPLQAAMPDAFDDSKIREHCAQAYANNRINGMAITKIWNLLN